jgi:methionyl-tRNA formyltransferase
MSQKKRIVVAGCKPWNRESYDQSLRHMPKSWTFVGAREELTLERLERLNPDVVFFLHWSWKIPAEIFERFTCIGFHMTDLPYGRGGSPLQNLIVRGHTKTMLTAFKIGEAMDAGPVYAKRPLSLAGTAEEIYRRANDLALEMMLDILVEIPNPQAQQGEPTIFTRRMPDQSELPPGVSLDALYDHIRMLDADTYPRAFARHDGLRFEFSRPRRVDGKIVAEVLITEDKE